MDLLGQTWAYAAENAGRVQQAMLVHLLLSFGALGIAMLVFIPLGVLASMGGKLTSAIVGAVAAVRVIPSLAVILLLLPVFGLGWLPALVALTLLAGPPSSSTPTSVCAASISHPRGRDRSRYDRGQRFWRVKVPLALPVIVTGVRSRRSRSSAAPPWPPSSGQGLGTFITSGITLMDERMLLTGALLVTLLALLTEWILARLELRYSAWHSEA